MQLLLSWITMYDRNLFVFINKQLRNSFLDVIFSRITHLGGATFTVSSMLIIILLGEGKWQ